MAYLRTNVVVIKVTVVSFLSVVASGEETSPLDKKLSSTDAAASPTDAGPSEVRDPDSEEEPLKGECANLCNLERDRKRRFVRPAIEAFIRQHKDNKRLDFFRA